MSQLPSGQSEPHGTLSGPQNDAAQAVPEDEQIEEVSTFDPFYLFQAFPALVLSAIVHFVALVIFALLPMLGPPEEQRAELVVPPAEEELEELEDIDLSLIEPVDVQELTNEPVADPLPEMVSMPEETEVVTLEMDLEAAMASPELVDFSELAAPKGNLMAAIGTTAGTGISGRGGAMKGELIEKYGGSAGSEAAVVAGMKWIATHQLPDGGWSFDHTSGPPNGSPLVPGLRSQKDPGTARSARRGATALALLPFLGSGQTHLEGTYKQTVAAGLVYLIKNIKSEGGAGSFREGDGSMYSHGLAAICLCEAYAMTHDQTLARPAQLALNYITYAQDPIGGGWRYQPKQPGDTSAVGWQIMSLKSGHLGYLTVNPDTIRKAERFLDAVSQDGGAFYGYTSPGKRPGTTAVGLLCRMYLGWNKNNPALQKGVDYLAATGPDTKPNADIYYNYYATQVMHHWGGEKWDTWNKKLRDFLIASQSKEGAESGSWNFVGGHANERGGRLYCTCMATMVLEVYYRHMPIYASQSTEEEFPL